MLKKIVISGILLLSSFFLKAQNQLPFHFPFPNSPTSYYNIGWMKSDSGVIIAVRDTSLRPRYAGTVVVWQHAGVDTSVWLWSGTRFFKMLRLGDVTGGGGITQLTGDIIAGPGSGVVNATLPNVNGNVGVFGTANSVGSFTANAKGQIVGASSISIQISESQVTNLTTDLASKIGLSSLGASPPLSYNNTTGQFSIQVGNGSQNGYITSTDWNTFNGKLSTSLSSAFIFVGNGSNVATGVAMSGDATISNTGALTLTSVIVSGSCTNCNISFDGKGRITTATSGSGGGGSGTVTTVGVGALSPLFTASTANATTTPFTSFTASTAPANSILSNLSGSTGAYGFNVPTITNLNTWAGATIAVSGANVSFGNLTSTGTVTLSGLLSGGVSDSVLTWNSTTHVVGVTNRILQLFGVQGISPAGSDSFQLGGSQSPFFKPDSIFENYEPFYFVNGLGKGTVAGTDSVNVTDIHGQQWHVPVSAIGGAGDAITSPNGSLTVGGTSIATTLDFNLGYSPTLTGTWTFNNVGIHFSSNANAGNVVGDGTNNGLSANFHQYLSNNNEVYGIGSSFFFQWNINNAQVGKILSTGQWVFGPGTGYVPSGGTPTLLFALDGTGASWPITLGTNLSFTGQTLNATGSGGGVSSLAGTAGGGLTGALSLAVATNTTNTAMTLPGSGTTITVTYNAAWDFIDNSRSAVTSVFLGTTMGNTSLSGTGDIGIGAAGSQNITSGSNDIGIGTNTNFAITTATGDISIGDLAGAGDILGGSNVNIGLQAGRNNTATQETFVGTQAGTSNTSGTSNAFFGFQAGFANTIGLGNTYLGNQAGKNATTAQHNTFSGWLAGTTDITGGDNSGHGFGNMSGLTDGTQNSGFGSLFMDFAIHNINFTGGGYKAAALDTASIGATIMGAYAASATLGLSYSTITGDSALGSSFPVSLVNATRSSIKAQIYGAYIGVVNTPGNMAHYDSSNLMGYKIRMAESSTDTLGYNIVWIGGFNDTTNRHDFIQLGNEINQILNFSYTGNGSGGGLTTARYVSIGGRLGDVFWNKDSAAFNYYDGTALHNFGTGSGGGGGLTTVAWSTTSNANAGSISGVTLTLTAADGTNPGGISEIAQTMGSGVKTFTSDAVIDGINAGKGSSSGAQNTRFGNGAMSTGGTYTAGTAIGFDALFNMTTSGVNNTAVGAFAGVNYTSGPNNTAIGYQAADNKYTGSFNTDVGSGADFGNSSLGLATSDNTAIGYFALHLNQGSDNTALGYLALQSNTTGHHNLAFSVGALGSNTTGNYNTATGAQSGNSLTTGSYELFIGPWVDAASPTETDTMRILNGLIGTGLSSPTALYNTPVTTFRLGIATYPNAAFTLTAGGAVQIGNFSNTYTWNPNNAIPGSFVSIQPGTLNDATTAASGTVANAYVTGITSPTLSATNTGVVVTNAYSFWINNQPVAGTNVTITNAYALGVTGNSLFNGTITSGAVNITGKADLTGQTGAVTVTTYAVPGSTTFNTFEIGGYITVTAVSLDVIQLQVTWTDETSTSRTQSFFVQGATTGISATGANAYSPMDIRVKKGTTITVATVLTTGTGSITYDVGGFITQLY